MYILNMISAFTHLLDQGKHVLPKLDKTFSLFELERYTTVFNLARFLTDQASWLWNWKLFLVESKNCIENIYFFPKMRYLFETRYPKKRTHLLRMKKGQNTWEW